MTVASFAISPGTLASVVIALSFAAGLNVYATALRPAEISKISDPGES